MRIPLAWVCLVLSVQIGSAASKIEADLHVQLRRIIGKGHYDEALRRCMKLLIQQPQTAQLYEMSAEIGQYGGQLPEVSAFLRERIRAGQNVPYALFGCGQVYLREGKWSNAMLMFERAQSFDLQIPSLYAGMELAFEKLNGVDAAIEYYLASSQRDPRNAGIWYSLALAYWSRADPENTLSAIDESLRLSENEPRFRQLKAGAMYTWLLDDQSFKAATHEIQAAIALCDFDGAEFVRWCLVDGLSSQGEWDRACAIAKEANKSVREFGQVKWTAHIHLALAVRELALGDLHGSLNHADSSSKYFSMVNDVDGLLSSRAIKIGILRESGSVQTGLKYCFEVFSDLSERSDSRLWGGAFIDAAWTFAEIGAFRIALAMGIEAQRILQRCLYADYDQVRLYTALGLIHQKIGNLPLAIRYQRRALGIAEATNAPRNALSTCVGQLAVSLLLFGDTLAARTHFRRQLNLARKEGDPGEEKKALYHLAELDLGMALYGAARRKIETAMDISRKQKDDRTLKQCYLLLGRIAEKEEKKGEAMSHYGRSLKYFNEERGRRHLFMMTVEMKEWYLTQHEEIVNALCRVGLIDEAFALIESVRCDAQYRYHSRSSESRRELRRIEGTSDVELIISSYRKSCRDISTKMEEDKIDWSLLLPALRKNLAIVDTLHQLEEVPGRIPELPATRNDSREIISHIRNRILQKGDALVEFWVGHVSTERFLLTRDTLVHHSLMLEKAKLNKWVIPLLDHFGGEGSISDSYRRERPSGQYQAELVAISDLLLGGLQNFLLEKGNLIVVAGQPLASLPFEGMVLRTASGLRQLVEEFAISYAPCIFALEPLPDLSTFDPADLLVLANPLPDKIVGIDAMIQADSIRSGAMTDGYRLELPAAVREAERIRAVFGSTSVIRLGREASEGVMARESAHFRIIHIAAHSTSRKKVSDRHAIILSPDEENDGILEYREIAALDLRSDLVVITGCRAGEPSRANDWGSLAEAFIEAGASSVIATHWDVEDVVADRLFGLFYSYLRSGESRARSLQLAKLSLMKDGFTDVRLWCGFRLFGRHHPIAWSKRDDGDAVEYLHAAAVASLLLMMASVVFYSIRRKKRKCPSAS